jgi:formate hydrogenlyase transcriptional activator
MNVQLINSIVARSRGAEPEPSVSFEARIDSGEFGHPGALPISSSVNRSCHGALGRPDCNAPYLGDFHVLMSRVIARLADWPLETLDQEVGLAFRSICACFEIQRAGLWWRGAKDPDAFTLLHLYPASEVSPGGHLLAHRPNALNAAKTTSVTVGMDARELFPWMAAQASHGKTVKFSRLSELPAAADFDRFALANLDIQSVVLVPFLASGRTAGYATFGLEREEDTWPTGLIECLELVTQVLGSTLNRSSRELRLQVAEEALRRSYAEVKELKDRLQAESACLLAEIKHNRIGGPILGQSRAIRQVLHQVEQVATADCPVLLTGETGTGKELIAREIHRLSSRKHKVMVPVNCAALPATLVESELFGREKGAFTGALTSQVGRFEVADGSTLFLDEIGELSPEIQAKLLRVLQGGEFQRLGSPRTHKVNVRIIAATNRNLAREVSEGRFREDLYYRLRVFPVSVPPLRERTEDIPVLVSAFLEEFCSRMSKKITRIPRNVMNALERHSWPGNIRELRNVIERGVILSPGDLLMLPSLNEDAHTLDRPRTLADVERNHILKTLKIAGWRIKGKHGAAQLLDINPSTLYSRMEKLGVQRSPTHEITDADGA